MLKNALIRVGVKIRPCSLSDRAVSHDQSSIIVTLPTEQTQTIEVDHIHDANESQQSIYVTAKMDKLIEMFMEGYNVAILSYGQTGSGKTFAFEGQKNHQGIIFHAIRDIYRQKGPDSSIGCTFIQLYNQKITDMFNHQQAQKGLKMRWQLERQFVIDDMIQKQCVSAEEMMKQWIMGNRNRIIASNKINQYSSRSHSIFSIKVQDQDRDGNYRCRQLVFVDLAGSQRVFSPVGRLSKQAIEINKSLFFLRKVIVCLEEMNTSHKQQYIPYRDSKLTSILKRAIGGNCLTYLIACINPHKDYIEQTLNTLQYAVFAGRIKNIPMVNVDAKAREIMMLRDEKEKLKRELQAALNQIQNFKALEREEEVKRMANNQYAARIIQCLGTVRELLKSNKALRAELQQQKLQKRRIARDLEQCQKNLRAYKKNNSLSPVKQSPNHRKSKLMNQTFENNGNISDRPLYSQSFDMFRKKQRGSSIRRRKGFTLHQSSKK